MSPFVLPEDFFTESINGIIVLKTNYYTQEVKIKFNSFVTKDEIQAFIGFRICSGYHALS